MTKVHGKRYAYKFDFNGLMAACQQQAQGGDPTVSMLSAANYAHSSISRDLNASNQVAATAMYSTVPSTLSMPLISNISQASIATSSPITSQSTVITSQAQSTSGSVIIPSTSNPTATTLHPSPHGPTSYW